MSDEKKDESEVSAAAVTTGEKPAKAKKALPNVTRTFTHPETGQKLVLVFNPNTGTYQETLTDTDGRTSKTVHTTFSHAWGVFREDKPVAPAK